MELDWERGLDPSKEWASLMDAIDVAAASPSRAKFTAVGQAAVEWARARRESPRDAAQHSSAETPLYKDIVAETQVWPHSPFDHAGYEHGSPECIALMDGGIPTQQAGADEA